MNMMFRAFFKKLFGARYERLLRSLAIDVIVYCGLTLADFHMPIAPFFLYLTVFAFTAGVMWQALSSKDQAVELQTMLMLPLEGRKFACCYTAALGIYTVLSKTAALLAVLLSVCTWNRTELAGSILCSINAVVMPAVVYSRKNARYAIGPCFFALPAVVIDSAVLFFALLFFAESLWVLPLLAFSIAFSFCMLLTADGYSFYRQESSRSQKVKNRSQCSILLYFFRYLQAHKNYLANTAAMWCAACVLPLFFSKLDADARFILPIGFAILSMNTPVCILLSCDPALERAVRFLPGQKKAFCVPYCLFIFLCNLSADTVFLCSMQIQFGGVTVLAIADAVFLALLIAACSVLLEWFYPIRNWKIESDLWHHPRKYVISVVILLLAGCLQFLP